MNGGNDYTIFDLKNKIVKSVKSTTNIDPMNTVNPAQNLDVLHIRNMFDAIKNGEEIQYSGGKRWVINIFENGLKTKMVRYHYQSIHPQAEYNYEVISSGKIVKSYFLKSVKAFWDNNQLMVEGNFNEKGKYIGMWSVFYPSGNLFTQGFFSADGYGNKNSNDNFENSVWPKIENIKKDADYLSWFFSSFDGGNKHGKVICLQEKAVP